MQRRRHMIAMVICVAAALCILVSSAYIVREAAHPHACVGDDCPICQLIAQVEQVRRGFGLLLLALLPLGFALALRPEGYRCADVDLPALTTLVSRKIRLNR